MLCASQGGPPSVVRISMISDFEATHAKGTSIGSSPIANEDGKAKASTTKSNHIII